MLQCNKTEHYCRTCLQGITSSECHTLIKSESTDITCTRHKLLTCFPEVDIDLVADDPVLCSTCFSAVHNAYTFKIRCLQIDTKIRSFTRRNKFGKKVYIRQVVQNAPFPNLDGELIEIDSDVEDEKPRIKKENKIIAGSDLNVSRSHNLGSELVEFDVDDTDGDEEMPPIRGDVDNSNNKSETDTNLISSTSDAVGVKPAGIIIVQDKAVTRKLLESATFLYKCDQCTEFFDNNAKLLAHKDTHKQPFAPAESFKCGSCGSIFETKFQVNAHMKSHHQQITVVKPVAQKANISDILCSVCGRTFDRKNSLVLHERMHHPKVEHSCPVCLKSFLYHSKMLEHMRTHARDGQRRCPICGLVFGLALELKLHLEDHSPRSTAAQVTPGVDNLYECEYCKSKFRTDADLLTHKKYHINPHICKLCGERFADESSLSEHGKAHTYEKLPAETEKSIYICHVCGNVYSKKDLLVVHIEMHTAKTKECEFCKKKFSEASSYFEHMMLHENKKTFTCNICGKQFSQQSHFQRHVNAHAGLACNMCERTFNQKNSLFKHMLTHTNKGGLVCKHCGKKFSQNRILVEHVRLHSNEVSYMCVACNKEFEEKTAYLEHMKAHIC